MYKIRVILDVEEDVIRTLVFDENNTLEKLHFDIANAFGFDGKEMASFYTSDNGWNQGDEIPLFNMADVGYGLSMQTCILNEVLPNQNDKLIYVYDFLAMWTFYVEVIEKSEEKIAETKTILSVGEVPSEAPNKVFESDDISNDFDSDFDDPFGGFENIDDLDLDNI
ncbi:IS1096 element passenger TnpR family protein [Tenacibaculum agarivorans]|uniref:IS1096 element passenger TnpR family protein n=1 Tax=Tenacibaculum agarivorans TaxID=1908389 RepID=UPI00094BB428|nr:hypothetical protein [Tenacibaculum agarivorans]